MFPKYHEILDAIPWEISDESELNGPGQVIQEIMDSLSPYEAFLRAITLDTLIDHEYDNDAS